MAKVSERDADRTAGGYPKKYWWLVLVLVPLLLAAIQFQPWKGSSPSSDAGRSVAAHEIGTAVLGDMSVVVNEAASAGTTIDPELRTMIEEAVKLGRQGQHDAAIARIEKVRQSSPGVAALPSLLTGLGAEYAAAGRPDQARKSFDGFFNQRTRCEGLETHGIALRERLVATIAANEKSVPQAWLARSAWFEKDLLAAKSRASDGRVEATKLLGQADSEFAQVKLLRTRGCVALGKCEAIRQAEALVAAEAESGTVAKRL